MMDFHTHTLLSDGEFLPSELVRRAKVIGYKALAITDHADASNLENVIAQTLRVCNELSSDRGFYLVPGVELTHIPPGDIPAMVRRARELGARIVVGHGETIVEPVSPGTNLAFIKAGVDLLAHPGLIIEKDCRLSARNSVFLELTARSGHSLSNGHVAAMAKRCGALLVLNTDSHGPGDLITEEKAAKVALGSGLDKNDLRRIKKNAETLLFRVAD